MANTFGYLGALLIIDHGDGSWSAIDESDTYITMIDDTNFQIDGADATYLDPDTYEVSSTNIGEETKEVKWLQLLVLQLNEWRRLKARQLLSGRDG